MYCDWCFPFEEFKNEVIKELKKKKFKTIIRNYYSHAVISINNIKH